MSTDSSAAPAPLYTKSRHGKARRPVRVTSKASEKSLVDIQSSRDYRKIEIDKVGVKNITYPVTLLDKAHGKQSTVAKVNMYVGLPHHFKGTHMSRFVEVLNEHRHGIRISSFPKILEAMLDRLDSESAHIEMAFPYFLERVAPVSKAASMLHYDCTFKGSLVDGKYDLLVGVNVPATSVCPCSKAISDGGAHNQRSIISVEVRFKEFIWLEDLIEKVESKASCEVYSLLKRSDEKYVTEKAYNNPKFVEDIVRDVAHEMMIDPNITWFSVEAENFESIHNHNAYALVEKWPEEPKGE
ncbi:MAG: GTP cyclohydrolase I FolE2 [Deltaproteobacteria bacterium]|nr:MAG: GTP cyclohydrolase I FolE2 [Deltaproteobacteria bacterium]